MLCLYLYIITLNLPFGTKRKHRKCCVYIPMFWIIKISEINIYVGSFWLRRPMIKFIICKPLWSKLFKTVKYTNHLWLYIPPYGSFIVKIIYDYQAPTSILCWICLHPISTIFIFINWRKQ